jgi:hypothetical protein
VILIKQRNGHTFREMDSGSREAAVAQQYEGRRTLVIISAALVDQDE